MKFVWINVIVWDVMEESHIKYACGIWSKISKPSVPISITSEVILFSSISTFFIGFSDLYLRMIFRSVF